MTLEAIERELAELDDVLAEARGPASSPRPIQEEDDAGKAALVEAVDTARTSIQEAVAALHKAGVALTSLASVLGAETSEEVSPLTPNGHDETEPRALRNDPPARAAAKPQKEEYPVGDVFPDDEDGLAHTENGVAVDIPPGVPLPKN